MFDYDGNITLTPYEGWRWIVDVNGAAHHVPDYDLLRKMSELYYGKRDD